MPARVAVLHHLDQPFLGNAEAPLRAAGVEIDERYVNRGDALPDLQGLDGILSLGGTRSMVDPDPTLLAEAELLTAAVGESVPVLGVCLGAQILAVACGGTVRHAGRQIGWQELSVVEPDDPLAGALPQRFPALHWNEDVFDLPPGAVELFSRPGPGVEGFRVGECAWGVQFHPDTDRGALDGWYSSYGDWLAQSGIAEDDARDADARFWDAHTSASDSLFTAFASVAARRALRSPAAPS